MKGVPKIVFWECHIIKKNWAHLFYSLKGGQEAYCPHSRAGAAVRLSEVPWAHKLRRCALSRACKPGPASVALPGARGGSWKPQEDKDKREGKSLPYLLFSNPSTPVPPKPWLRPAHLQRAPGGGRMKIDPAFPLDRVSSGLLCLSLLWWRPYPDAKYSRDTPVQC